MSTLAEAKDYQRHLRAKQATHKEDCSVCKNSRGKRAICEERDGLAAELRRITDEIKSWFAMPPGAESLF